MHITVGVAILEEKDDVIIMLKYFTYIRDKMIRRFLIRKHYHKNMVNQIRELLIEESYNHNWNYGNHSLIRQSPQSNSAVVETRLPRSIISLIEVVKFLLWHSRFQMSNDYEEVASPTPLQSAG